MTGRSGLKGKIITCESRKGMGERIQAAVREGVPWVAVAGGDGTVHAAAGWLVGTATALGIVPVGTQNNFARALGLPMDPESAIRVIAAGKTTQVDLGLARCNEARELFTEAAGVGVFADILKAYGPSNKNVVRGTLAIVKGMLDLRPRRLTLTVDDRHVIERAVMCTAANSPRIGLGATIAPGASLTDGKLDLVILGGVTRLELIRYYRAIKANRHQSLPKTMQVHAKFVRIESERHMAVHVDDHILGSTPAEVSIEPKAMRVIIDSGPDDPR